MTVFLLLPFADILDADIAQTEKERGTRQNAEKEKERSVDRELIGNRFSFNSDDSANESLANRTAGAGIAAAPSGCQG